MKQSKNHKRVNIRNKPQSTKKKKKQKDLIIPEKTQNTLIIFNRKGTKTNPISNLIISIIMSNKPIM